MNPSVSRKRTDALAHAAEAFMRTVPNAANTKEGRALLKAAVEYWMEAQK